MRASMITSAAGLLGAIGVAGAAYAAHGGDARLAAVGSAICLVHAPAILVVGLVEIRTRALLAAAFSWTLGVVLFSGDLLFRAVFEPASTIPTAPIGGTLLVVGWLCAAVAGFRLQSASSRR